MSPNQRRQGTLMTESQFEGVALWIVLMLLMMTPWVLEVIGVLK